MPHGNYTVGPPVRPSNIVHDNGFLDGHHSARQPTRIDYVRLNAWRGLLEVAEAAQGVPGVPHNHLPDALAAYRHFLNGNGIPRNFSYERYVSEDPSGRTTLANALTEAQEAAQTVYQGNFAGNNRVHFQITGSGLGAGSGRTPWFPYPSTENWQKAIGAYWLWISGEVDVTVVSGRPQYTMAVTIHIEDRYNFNPGAQDINTSIPDQQNGELELSGLGRQYMNYSTLVRNLNWSGAASTPTLVTGAPTSRQREPNDNFRLRNRL